MGHVARMGKTRNSCDILIGKSVGKNLFGRPRRSWEGNIKLDITKKVSTGVDWIHVAQHGDCGTLNVMNLQIP